MFSPSTFSRYLFDMETTNEKMRSLYQGMIQAKLAPELRAELERCLEESQRDEKLLSEIKGILQHANT